MQTPALPFIAAVFAGRPKVLHDERGQWRSSIARERVAGAVEVTTRGLAGDRCNQRFHGGPDSALCIHLADHYSFWKRQYGIDLAPGGIGENLVVAGLLETEVFVGDIVRLGSTLAQVSSPRMPCQTQARKVGRADWVKLTLQENRTGLYMRVLEPGHLCEGDTWQLQDRLNENASVPAINQCMHQRFDPAFAESMLGLHGLAGWWQKQAAKRLASHAETARTMLPFD